MSKRTRARRVLALVLLALAVALWAMSLCGLSPWVGSLRWLRHWHAVRRINRALERQLADLEQHSFRLQVAGDAPPAMEAVTLENVGGHTLRHVWLWLEGRPNYFNLKALNRSIMGQHMSVRQKALALLEFFRRFPHFPPSGGPQCADPVRAFAVDGYGWCNTKARNAAAMLELEGIRVRPVALPGDHVADEFYDPAARKWSFIDFDLLKYFVGSDGAPLSYEELARRARTRPGLRQDDYFRLFFAEDGSVPLQRAPDPNESALEATLCGMDPQGNRRVEKASFWAHSMQFNLRPGESVHLKWRRGGFYYSEPAPPVPGDPTPRRSDCGGILFSNGLMVWRPPLERLNAFLREGRPLDGTGVSGRKDGQGAALILTYRCPYVIVDAALELAADTSGSLRLCYRKPPERYAYYRMLRRVIGGPLSPAPGWKLLWEHRGGYRGTVSLGRLFCHDGNRAGGVPHYEGALRLEFRGDPQPLLRQLALRLTFQSSLFGLRSLELSPGENVVNIYGPPLGQASFRREAGRTLAIAEGGGLRVTFAYRENKAPGR